MKQKRLSPVVFFAAMPILILSVLLYQGKSEQPIPQNHPSTSVTAATHTAWVRGTQAITTTTTTTQTTTTTASTAKTQPAAQYVGAYPAFLSTFPLNEDGIPVKYTKVIEGTACAYTARSDAVTATGTTPQLGTVAVNPKVIPYGSKLFIVSTGGYVYGYAVAEDTGGDLLNNNILVDLYMETREDCLNFGRRNVKIYVLE